MNEVAELLKQKFADRLAGEMESVTVDAFEIYFKPQTGAQQKEIQRVAAKDTVEGICKYVQVRALDAKGAPIFKDVALAGMLNDFDYEKHIYRIFSAISNADISTDDVAKN